MACARTRAFCDGSASTEKDRKDEATCGLTKIKRKTLTTKAMTPRPQTETVREITTATLQRRSPAATTPAINAASAAYPTYPNNLANVSTCTFLSAQRTAVERRPHQETVQGETQAVVELQTAVAISDVAQVRDRSMFATHSGAVHCLGEANRHGELVIVDGDIDRV